GAGDKTARVTPALIGTPSPWSGSLWATLRNRDRFADSAIFSYSPGLPPRPHWLGVSLPAADRDPGWAEWASARRGVDRGRGGRTEEEREGGELAKAGCGACGV
ncbi:hypothetical protein P7K49_029063, partial [Saguinus oedipus]